MNLFIISGWLETGHIFGDFVLEGVLSLGNVGKFIEIASLCLCAFLVGGGFNFNALCLVDSLDDILLAFGFLAYVAASLLIILFCQRALHHKGVLCAVHFEVFSQFFGFFHD